MTENEAKEKIAELCRTLGTAPMFICDPLLNLAFGMPSVDPNMLERWMERRHLIREGESIRDALKRNYGEGTAALAESLI